MELRVMVAYGLMAAMGGAGTVWAALARRRLVARRLRMRGIKSHTERAR